MRTLRFLLLIAAVSLPLTAARDFLTTDEADQVRLAQEPNARLLLYTGFARQRIEMLDYLLAKEEAGRSSLIHETLGDYTKIIETIDIVADDAIARGVDVTEGITAVADAEEEFAAKLEAILESKPRDLPRYRFVLDTAVETTTDSLEVSLEDLGDRKLTVAEQKEREQRRLETMMTPEMKQDMKKDTAEFEEKEEEEKKKVPSLFKKDEKKPEKP